MVDGIFFNNGEGRSGWVGSVNINVCPNLRAFLVLRIPKKNLKRNKDINYLFCFLLQTTTDLLFSYNCTFALGRVVG